MKVKYYIDTGKNVIIENFEGDLTPAILEKCNDHLWSHPDYSPSLDGIMDMRKCNLLFAKEDIGNLVNSLAGNEISMRGRIAILVSKPMVAAMVTIYSEEMKEFHSVGIFCEESEVIRFLNIDPAIFDRINDPDAITMELE